jgi:aromatase
MTAGEIRVRHATVVDAPPSAVYDLIVDVSRWPVIFRPTVHTRVLTRAEEGDRFEIWATVSEDEVRAWRSRRDFDAAGGTVTFRQDHDRTSFGHMGGGWTCAPHAGGGTRVVLEHRYNPPPDQDGARQRIARELDHNSSVELEALRTVATLPGGVDSWLLTFTESTELAGEAAAAREFVRDADRWPQRLPHVAGLDLVTWADGTQDMTMRTRAPDGSEHTTRSLRVLLEDGSIVYKQTRPPRTLLGHAGRWEFHTGRSGASIRSTHTFLLDPAGVVEVFGPAVEAADAMARVRAALAANSRVTMEHASRYSASAGAMR